MNITPNSKLNTFNNTTLLIEYNVDSIKVIEIIP